METHRTQTSSPASKDPYINITLDEAVWLMNKLGLSPGHLSPFQKAKGLAGRDAEGVSLAGKELLDKGGNVPAAIASCMKTIANPGCEMIIDIGNAALLNFMRIYFGPGGSPAGCTPIGKSIFRLAPELQFEDILVTILEGLNLDSGIRENPFACDCSPKGLLALSTLIDAVRQNQLRSLLNRNDNEGVMVDFIDIWACLQHGILEDDFRWLTTVIRSRLPDDLTIDQKLLSEGLAEMSRAGIAVRDDDSWTIADNHIAVLTELMTPLNFGSIFARGLSAGEAANLFLMRCPSSLWAVNFTGKDGRVSFFTISVDRLGSVIAEITARLMAASKGGRQTDQAVHGAAAPVSQEPSAHQTGGAGRLPPQAAVKTVRFCSQCGQPVKPEHKFCKGCGKAV